jgi:hypothetical protein
LQAVFLTFDENLASARYRGYIPIRELEKLGVEMTPAADTLVCSKHGWDPAIVGKYRHVIYDVCDDHFDDDHADFYRGMVGRADLVTCNSQAMQSRIREATRVEARVIPDPYELDERPPSWGEGLTWFGHESNLVDLAREAPRLKGFDIRAVSSPVMPGIIPWSRQAVIDALDRCAVAIIPTGTSPLKSANRLVEAARRGKFVVANPLPAYEEFAPFMWVGDIREGIEWAYAHREQCLARVAQCQDYIRPRFSPERVGRLWLEALASIRKEKGDAHAPPMSP